MILFAGADLAFNSSLDYDVYNVDIKSLDAYLLFGAQVFCQVSIFLVLFLAMAETFLFRVGLLGLLLKKFRAVLLFQPIYIALTIWLGLTRTERLGKSDAFSELWTDKNFAALVIIHKMAALLYYVVNIKAIMKLGDPIYFNKDAWITLLREQRKLKQHVVS